MMRQAIGCPSIRALTRVPRLGTSPGLRIVLWCSSARDSSSCSLKRCAIRPCRRESRPATSKGRRLQPAHPWPKCSDLPHQKQLRVSARARLQAERALLPHLLRKPLLVLVRRLYALVTSKRALTRPCGVLSRRWVARLWARRPLKAWDWLYDLARACSPNRKRPSRMGSRRPVRVSMRRAWRRLLTVRLVKGPDLNRHQAGAWVRVFQVNQAHRSQADRRPARRR